MHSKQPLSMFVLIMAGPSSSLQLLPRPVLSLGGFGVFVMGSSSRSGWSTVLLKEQGGHRPVTFQRDLVAHAWPFILFGLAMNTDAHPPIHLEVGGASIFGLECRWPQAL